MLVASGQNHTSHNSLQTLPTAYPKPSFIDGRPRLMRITPHLMPTLAPRYARPSTAALGFHG